MNTANVLPSSPVAQWFYILYLKMILMFLV